MNITLQVKHLKVREKIWVSAVIVTLQYCSANPTDTVTRKDERKLSIFVGYINVALEDSRESTDSIKTKESD